VSLISKTGKNWFSQLTPSKEKEAGIPMWALFSEKVGHCYVSEYDKIWFSYVREHR
jgi:hypothetical protein